MTQQNQNPNPTSKVNDDEIDLIALAKTVWEGRKSILKITLIFMAIGLFVAVFSKKEYTSISVMLPQVSEGAGLGGNLGGLAAMAGINLGSMMGESGISPDLYPQILESLPFQKELLQTPLTIQGYEEPISYYDYYLKIYSPGVLGNMKKYSIGLPGLIKKYINGYFTNPSTNSSNEKFITINEDEKELIEGLESNISVSINKKDGYVTVSAVMPEPIAAAEMANRVNELLQKHIIGFKIKKSENQLEFIKVRFLEVEKKFRTLQQELAKNKDRNQNVTTAMARTTTEMLQDDYDLVYGVYSQLAKQLEAQYIQVTDDTPIFTIIKPVSVPYEKSAPKRILILLVSIFLGLITGVGLILGKEYIKKVKKIIKE